MSKVSFEEIGAVRATFLASDEVQNGQVVKLTKSNTVAPCADGELFCGVASTPRKGVATVQVKGFVSVPGASLRLGWTELVANGKGGVRLCASGETGVRVLVVSTATNTICL